MDSGKLDTLVLIEQASAARDGFGQPITTWTTLSSVWAWVIFKSGLETVSSQENITAKRASVRINYYPEVTEAMRVKIDGVIFNIQSVIHSTKKDYTDLVVEAGFNNG